MENLPHMEVSMEIKEYLSQSYRLNQQIESNLLEIERLKEMSLSVSAICYDREVVQTTRSTEAYFVKCLAKIDELSLEIDEEVKLMVELKKQIRDTIMNVENIDEKMVLVYRYIQNHTWEDLHLLILKNLET